MYECGILVRFGRGKVIRDGWEGRKDVVCICWGFSSMME